MDVGLLRARRTGALLLYKVECAGAADDAKAFSLDAGAFALFELRLDVVAVVFAFVSEDTARVFS